MTEVFRDRLLSGVLLAVSIAWLAASKYTVPEGYSGSFFGPRAFPYALGLLLLALSLMLLAETFFKRSSVTSNDGEEGQSTMREEVTSSFMTFGFLITYFVGLYFLGFVLSTILMIAGFLWLVLRVRSIVLVGGMSLGFAFGLWILMGKLLGVYLPTGIFSWGF